jgi:hypothetical protein
MQMSRRWWKDPVKDGQGDPMMKTIGRQNPPKTIMLFLQYCGDQFPGSQNGE